jgi:hypothetical protein
MRYVWLSIGLRLAVLTIGLAASSASASNVLRLPADPIPRSYFGMHIHRAAEGTPWPTVPFGSWRLWDAGVPWSRLEPTRGKWDFKTLDREVDLAQQHNLEVLLTLGRPPAWASARPNEQTGRRAGPPGGAAEPRNLNDWRDYVRTLAGRYKGRIHGYEVWNEPNLPAFYTGTPETMVTLAREVYLVVKGVDPGAVVVSPSPVGPTGLPWLESFLAGGGGRYVDVIGYHLYVRRDPPEAMVDRAREVQAVLAKYGVAEKPLWDTEAGRQTWGGPAIADDSPDAPAFVARSYILNWAAGVRRYFWYAWDNTGMAIRMTRSDESTLTPSASAYASIESWLVGARMTNCTNDGSIWICELQRNGKSSWLVWNTNGSSRFTPPSSWNVKSDLHLSGEREVFGPRQKAEIGIVPVLFEPISP